jgi:O-antigen/teichoic acid export membrane protein
MSFRRNALANYLGQGWAALMGLAFIPQYLRLLGADAYGLVGIFSVLQASMSLLDLGITPTVNREMARLTAGVHTGASIRRLLRSFEWVYCGVAAVGMAIVWFGAHLLVARWIQPGQLPTAMVVQSIRVMGFVLAARAIEQMYRGSLLGLQDVIWLNTVQALVATIRWGGAFLVLTASPRVSVFFAWQGLASAATVVLYCWRIYRLLPTTNEHIGFELKALLEIRGFAGGMFVGALLSVLLTQTDKIVVSRVLPLATLGYYTLASSLAGGLLQLIAPMNNAMFPIFSEQVARGDGEVIRKTYLKSCEWMAALIVPPALVITFFAKSTALAWTGSANVATLIAPVLALLAFGTLLHGLMNVPYILQLAYGWISLSVWMNIGAALVVVPCLIWAVPNYGTTGAASAWLALNVAYLLVNAHFMHARILRGAKLTWYVRCVLRPLAAGIATAMMMIPLAQDKSRAAAAAFVVLATLAIAVSVGYALPEVRGAVLGRLAWGRRST